MTITFERLCLFSDFVMVQHFCRITSNDWKIGGTQKIVENSTCGSFQRDSCRDVFL